MNFKLVIFLITIAVASAVKNYDGFKVYNIAIKNQTDLNVVKDVQNRNIGEFWEDLFDVNHVVKVMVAPEKQAQFVEVLKTTDVEVTEVIDDLQRLINDQMKPVSIKTTDSFHSLNWYQYHSLEAIYAWIDELVEAYPNVVSSVTIGESVEGRPIRGVIIKHTNTDLIGVLEGTLHAREWISAATVTWIIKELLTSTNPEIRALANNFEWHLFPVVNPDGYVYTFTNNRMWRKNRSTNNFKSCGDGVDDDMSNGVDLNRNFDFMWMSIGASDDSCTNTYAGPSPASEPETKAIAEYAKNLNDKGRLIYYIAIHSYSQLIIVPYSHLASSAAEGLPDNYADMYEIAQNGRQAIFDTSGKTYRVGLSAEVMYAMSGTSFDWVKANTNVPVCYLFELRDLGEYGFLLNSEQIIDTAVEITNALLEMDKSTRNIGYYVPSEESGSEENGSEDNRSEENESEDNGSEDNGSEDNESEENGSSSKAVSMSALLISGLVMLLQLILCGE